MPVHCKMCKLCGRWQLPVQLAEGMCLECFVQEKGRIFIDPEEFASKLLELQFELTQLKEENREALERVQKYKSEIVNLRLTLTRIIDGKR